MSYAAMETNSQQNGFSSLVASGDLSGAVRALDEAIVETKTDFAAALHRLVALHLNRGLCNQKLNLNRKALKVGAARRLDSLRALCVRVLLYARQMAAAAVIECAGYGMRCNASL